MEQNKDRIVIDLREVFGIIKRKIAKVLIVTALFVCAAGGYIYITPNKYESKAIVYVMPNKSEYTVNVATAERFHELMKALAVFENSAVDLRDRGINITASQIAEKIKIDRKRNSNFIDVIAQDSSPERACVVAQAVGERGVKYVISCIADALNSEIAVYRAKIQSNRLDNLYGAVYADMVKLEAEKEALSSNIKIIENASINPVPVAPRKMRIIAVTMVIGLICGSMYVVLKEKL